MSGSVVETWRGQRSRGLRDSLALDAARSLSTLIIGVRDQRGETVLMKAGRSAFSLGFTGLGTIGPAGLGVLGPLVLG